MTQPYRTPEPEPENQERMACATCAHLGWENPVLYTGPICESPMRSTRWDDVRGEVHDTVRCEAQNRNGQCPWHSVRQAKPSKEPKRRRRFWDGVWPWFVGGVVTGILTVLVRGCLP